MSDPKPTARRGPKAKRRGPPWWWRPVALGLAGLVAAGVSMVAVRAMRLIEAIQAEHRREPVGGLAEGSDFSKHPRNVLVIGSDSRAGLSPLERAQAGGPEDVEGERSDTIILMHLDADRDEAVVVHFPRDLRVEIPGHGVDKINAAYELGGPDLAVRTLNAFTGLPIHNYVEVDFAGFQKIVDALHGVRICVDRPMFDALAGLNLPHAGCYWLDGRGALAFVRARHVEGDVIPDFSRIRRQQQFMRAFFNRLISLGSFFDDHLIRTAAGQVTTDDRLDAVDLLYLGQKLRELAEEDPAGAKSLDFRVVPGTPQTIDGVSFVVPQEPQAHRLFRALRTRRSLGTIGLAPKGLDESPAVIEVRVLDAGAPEESRAAGALLRRAGFVVFRRREAPAGFDRSEIVFRPGADSRARVVGGFFPGVATRQVEPSVLGGADVAVVIAEDYRPRETT